jgi:hypothetical protein
MIRALSALLLARSANAMASSHAAALYGTNR